MTKQQAKTYLALPGAAVAFATALFFIGNAAFVSHAELLPVQAQVDSLEFRYRAMQSDITVIRENLTLTVCLQLADIKGTSWQACIQEHER